jgi:UDP-N-acetylglucosamine 2-epimerase (non-hydrolysing)
MIDTLRHHQQHAIPFVQTLQRYQVTEWEVVAEHGYALITMHRPSNVDDPAVLEDLIGTLERASERLPLVFPVHPRTNRALEALRIPQGRKYPIVLLPAVGYLEALGLMSGARIVLTDSGGMQEETTAIGVCCLTLRDNTERPITIDEGTNILTGNDRERILECLDDTLATGGKSGRIPELWDGHAGDRIAEVLYARYASKEMGTRSVTTK